MTALVRVVVTVGTDHHRFDRLMSWVDDAVLSGVLGPDELVVQHGASAKPTTVSDVRSTIPRRDLIAMMGIADVVVGHGGPGTVMDARGALRLPLIVPRLARFDEVVDDHQVAFARELAASGLLVLAEDAESFQTALRTGLGDPASLRLVPGLRPDAAATEVARRVERIVGELVGSTTHGRGAR